MGLGGHGPYMRALIWRWLKTPPESGFAFLVCSNFARFSYERLYDWTASSELRLADLEMTVLNHGVWQGPGKGEGYMVFCEIG